MSSTLSSIKHWPARAAVGLISVYQRTLSPDHGLLQPWFPHGACKFRPTCSEYTRAAILRHGLIRGIRFGLARLVRCHPWSIGGYDPIH